MSSIGRLLTPYTQVTWGDLELSAWEYSEKEIRPVVYDVEFSLQAGDKKVNNASMSFDPSPVGFAAYSTCIGKDNIDKPIKIRFGYENGSYIETVYFFQDVDFATGAEQTIKVNLAGLHKETMSASWWSEYIGDGTKEFSVKEMWNTLSEKIGLEMVWSDAAEKQLETLPKIRQAAIIKEPIGTFMIRTAEEYGFTLEWPSSSEEDHKKIIVKTSALAESSSGDLKVTEKSINKGKAKNGGQRVNERQAFILGPTLVNTVNRKTNPSKASKSPQIAYAIRTGATQDTSKGQLYSESNRTTSQPSSSSSSSSSESLSSQANTDFMELAQKAKQRLGDISSTTSNSSGVQPTAASSKTEQAVGEQAQKKPPGTATPTGLDTKDSVDDNGNKIEGEQLKKNLKSKQDAKNKKELNEFSECSCDVFMVPYMVGIQPKDFIVFPSLNAQDPYLEDWEVKSVSYKQQGAAVLVSLSGVRPKPGADPLIVDGDLSKLKKRVASMTTLKDWESYYWSRQ